MCADTRIPPVQLLRVAQSPTPPGWDELDGASLHIAEEIMRLASGGKEGTHMPGRRCWVLALTNDYVAFDAVVGEIPVASPWSRASAMQIQSVRQIHEIVNEQQVVRLDVQIPLT